MNRFSSIKRVILTEETISQTIEWLKIAGLVRCEALVLWAGEFASSEVFMVSTAIYPEQTPIRSPNGIGYVVDSEELFKVNKWLYENDRILIAQIHSHPTHAFHSDTDNKYPLVTATGQFSIVVPFFAQDPNLDIFSCAFFRLSNWGTWLTLTEKQIKKNFIKVDYDGNC
ncbi:MAG: hypothetical protein VR67_05510 [Peptococcaceae bacterium BRH_c8a]|nr:MAG: hypothetical protein VR67_05510 [Peptococcaceae bacterium BRH_c8a]